MAKFVDMLNSELPSKKNTPDDNTSVVKEGVEEEVSTAIEEDTDINGDGLDDELNNDVEDLDEDDDEGVDDMSEEELEALDKELSDGALDDAIGDDEEEDEINLSPEEEVQADDMMKIAATAMLVNDEMSVEERANFIQSKEAEIAITEGFMTDTDVNAMSVECGLVTESNYNKKMIIRLDAESKKKQLKALAVNVSAAAHKDPDYYKLKKVMKVRKILRRKLEKKYNAEATKRMKVYFARLKNSKSGSLNKIAAKHS